MDPDQDPRWLRLRPSRIHLALTVVGTLVACSIIALLPLPWGQRLALIAAVTLLATWETRRARLLGAGAINAFYLLDAGTSTDATAGSKGADGALAIRLRYDVAPEQKASAEVEGVVLPGAYVTPWFSNLPYRLPNDPRWRQRWPRIISLWPDSLDADSFRRVRVQLKWK